jgi:hypothetical protein
VTAIIVCRGHPGLMKAFDPGGMEIIETLTSFPGVGESGQIGGAITGSLIAFAFIPAVMTVWTVDRAWPKNVRVRVDFTPACEVYGLFDLLKKGEKK